MKKETFRIMKLFLVIVGSLAESIGVLEVPVLLTFKKWAREMGQHSVSETLIPLLNLFPMVLAGYP